MYNFALRINLSYTVSNSQYTNKTWDNRLATKKMNTFTLNIPRDIRNWSYALDAKTILCSRSWIIINEGNVKEVYIFQEDGTLILSYNGKVCKTRWEYIAQNTSLIIEDTESDTYMLKPAYYDNKVLVLQVDGTNEYAIMVNESHIGELMLDSIDEIKQYIECQQKMANQVKEASFALNKNYLDHFTNAKAENDLKPHETRTKLIKSRQKRKNINIGIGVTAVSFLVYSVLNYEILSIYAFAIFSLIIIALLIVLIFRESHRNSEYNTFLKIEKKHPLQWFNQ